MVKSAFSLLRMQKKCYSLNKKKFENVVGYLSLRYQYLGSEFYDVDVTSTNIESSSSKLSRSA